MNKIPSGVKWVSLYLLVNIVYLCLLGNIEFLRRGIELGPFLPLTKLWLATLLNFAGFNGFQFVLPIDAKVTWAVILVVNALAFAGILSLKNWARRILFCLLLSMMVWVLGWVMISGRAMEAMDVFMRRAYNAALYNQYWNPIKREYCSGCPQYSGPAKQYEPAVPLSDAYQTDQKLLECKFPSESPLLASAYWGIFRVGQDAFGASKELFGLLFIFVRTLMIIWFVLVPVVILYYFTRKEIKEVFSLRK